MINAKFKLHGAKALIYTLDKNTCLKVFYGPFDTKHALYDWAMLNSLGENKINVPRVQDIFKINVSKSDIPKSIINTWIMINKQRYNLEWNDFLGERFAIKREFIQGKSLGTFIFPNKIIKENVIKLNKEIQDLGYIVNDNNPENYIVKKNKEVFLIDCSSVKLLSEVPVENHHWAQTREPIITISDYNNLNKNRI